MMVFGLMTKLMEKELTSTLMVRRILETGSRISSMEKVLRHGLMEQSMRVVTKTVKKMVKAHSSLPMDQSTPGSFSKMRLVAPANTFGQMVKLTMEIGSRIRCTVKAS